MQEADVNDQRYIEEGRDGPTSQLRSGLEAAPTAAGCGTLELKDVERRLYDGAVDSVRGCS